MSLEKVTKLMEKSCPTDKGKWAASKAAAKRSLMYILLLMLMDGS